jgi:hypothetical protein
MIRTSLGLLVVAGCSGSSSNAHQDAASDAPATNPHMLWLAPDMAETAVKLIETEPPPF